MTFRASSGGWGRSPGRMASSGTLADTSFAGTVASWYTANNAPGRFDFFSDWATSGLLYQDSAFTTPVTALEQPVGGRLDRSRAGARGPELMTNGDFSAGLSGYTDGKVGTGTVSVTDGVLTMTGTDGVNRGAISQPLTFSVGRLYEMTWTGTGNGTIGVATTPGFGANVAAAFTNVQRLRFIATSANLFFVSFNSSGGGVITLDNISVKEILGSHRIQPTTTKRPILSARVNWLTNSAWAGGGAAPTGWAQAIATGTSVPNGTIDSNTIYRQTAVAQRPFFSVSVGTALGVSGSLVGSGYVGQIYSGSAFISGCIGWSGLPAGATVTYWKDGIVVLANEPVTAGSRIACVVTSGGTAGTPQFRIGLGCGGNDTCDAEFSRPQLDVGTVPGRYQRTGLSPQTGDYDAVGFPVGLRYDGVDDGMYTAAPIDYSGTDKVTVSYPLRKETNLTGFVFEHGPATSGTAGTLNCYNSAGDYRFELRGDAAAPTAQIALTPVAPYSCVASCGYDIAGADRATEVFPRLNGSVPTLSPGGGTTAGGGLLTSQVSYEGARADTSNRFTGMIYGEFQIGMLLTADQLTYLEANFNALLLDQGPPANLLLAKAAAASAPTSVASIAKRSGPVYGLTTQGGTPPWSYQRYWISGSGKDNGGGGTSNPRLDVAMFIYNFVRWTKVFGGGVTNNMGDGSQAEYWSASSEQGGNPAMIGVTTNSRYVAFPTQSFGDVTLVVDGEIVVPGVDYTTDNQNAYWDLGSTATRNLILITGYNTWVSEVLLADGATVAPYDFTVAKPLTTSFQGDSYMGHNSYTVNGMSLMDMMTRQVGGIAITACHRGGTGYRSDDGGGATWYANSPIRVARVTEAQPTIVANCVAINDPWPGAAPTTTLNMQEAIARTRAAAPGSIMVVMGPWAPKESDGTNPAGSYIAKMDTLAGIMQSTAGPWILLDNLRGNWKTSKGTQRTSLRGAWQTGDGNVSAPTGIGNGDTWVAGDGVHPTTPVGITGLSEIWAAEVRAALASM